MNKCLGCGVGLQNNNSNLLGYTKDLNKNLCERCFRIRNYNDYQFVFKDNNDYIDILKDVGKTNDLVILVVDLFNISENLKDIEKYIKNDILLVLTKRDILPKSVFDENIKKYFNSYKFRIVDTVIISSSKNYNFDYLLESIYKHKKSDKVYVVGFTNSGKSSMINKIIYNYSKNNNLITTSNLPSTTINSIEVTISNDLILVDTPGLLNSGDLINYIESEDIKKVIPSKEIRPITYQIKCFQSIVIDNYCRVDFNNLNSATLYMSNNLNVKRYFNDKKIMKNFKKYDIIVNEDSDIVIQGLGFINVKKRANVCVYVKDGINVFTRKSLI